MKKKSMQFSLVALIVILAISVMSPDAWAKPGGGGRSSGSSRSSSWSKPAAPKVSTPTPAAKPKADYTKPAATAPATPANTYTKPSNPSAGNAAATSNSQVGGAVSKQRAKSALDSYRAKAAPPRPTANPTATTAMTGRARGAGINNRDQYYAKRDDYWSNRAYTPPTYAYAGPSMFGNFDGLFLWMMLDSVQDAQMMNFYRGNASDPDMKAWREQAEKEAANNAELKAKLAALDAKVAEMDKTGVKVEPGFIPAGAEAAVLAASVADSQLPAAPEVVAEKPQQPEKSGWGMTIVFGGVAIVACLVVAAFIFR